MHRAWFAGYRPLRSGVSVLQPEIGCMLEEQSTITVGMVAELDR